MLTFLTNLAKDIGEDDNRKQKTWRLLLLEILSSLIRKDSPQQVIESFHNWTNAPKHSQSKCVIIGIKLSNISITEIVSL